MSFFLPLSDTAKHAHSPPQNWWWLVGTTVPSLGHLGPMFPSQEFLAWVSVTYTSPTWASLSHISDVPGAGLCFTKVTLSSLSKVVYQHPFTPRIAPIQLPSPSPGGLLGVLSPSVIQGIQLTKFTVLCAICCVVTDSLHSALYCLPIVTHSAVIHDPCCLLVYLTQPSAPSCLLL